MSFRCCFKCLYNIYNSKIGRWFHNCMMINRHHRRLRSSSTQEHSHVDKEVIDFGNFKVKIIPLGRTNYAYFLQDARSGELAVVDPGDPILLQQIAAAFFDCEISVVLITHRHWDHSAGVVHLRKKYPNLRVYCSDLEPAVEITHWLKDGEIVLLGSTRVKCISTPVHTKGSMCFYAQGEGGPGAVFTGDTFFVGGMGAYFEGDLKAAASSIAKVITLPEETYLFPGHEYAEMTLKFAAYLQPNNVKLKEKAAWVVRRRNQYKVTIPSTVKEEKSYNPFLRIYEPDFIATLESKSYLHALAKLQELRVKKRNEYKDIELA